MSDKVNYKSLLKDKNFLKIFIAGIISKFGDSVDVIAYSYMVYELTGSATLMAALFAVNGIPSFVFNMVSGVVVSYMHKKRVIYVCDALRGLVVLVTGVLYFTGYIAVWHLYLFTILNSTLEAFRAPSSSSLFVQIISKDKLEHATSLNTSARTFAELIGYAAAGILIGVIGVGGAIIIDGVTFFVSAFIIMRIVMDSEVLTKEKLTVKRYFMDLGEGFTYLKKDPFILSLSLFAGGMMFFVAPFNALQGAYVLEVLDLGAIGISVLSISFMVAMVIGGVMVPFVSKKIGSRYMFVLGGCVIGIGYFGLSLIEVFKGQQIGYVFLALVSFVMGSTISFMSVPIQVAFMKRIDHSLLTRVVSLINVLALAAVPLGGGLTGLLVKFYDITLIFKVFSIAVILLFLLQLFNKSFRELDGPTEVDEKLVESV